MRKSKGAEQKVSFQGMAVKMTGEPGADFGDAISTIFDAFGMGMDRMGEGLSRMAPMSPMAPMRPMAPISEVRQKRRIVCELGSGEIKRILSAITYKPGWRFEFELQNHQDQFSGRFNVSFLAPDRDNPRVNTRIGFWQSCGPFYEEEEVLRGLLGVILHLEQHEAQEMFLYKKVRIFDPHLER